MKPHRLVTRMLVSDQDNRFLLVRNPDEGFWYPPGGGVEVGETLTQAAIREVLEETGISARVERLLFVVEFMDSRLQNHNIELFFLGTIEGFNENSSELEHRWFEKNELVDNTSIFPQRLREPDWGGLWQVRQNLYLGVEQG